MQEPFNEANEFAVYFEIQTQMREKVIKVDQLDAPIKFVAGVDVAYDEAANKMIGAAVVLDSETLEVVDQAIHEMDITFPYVPGLFSFREIPALKEAIQQLTTKPSLIICDGHGIAHPKNVGMATHLGIELDIPTIGCGKTKLVGDYDRSTLDENRGAIQELVWNDEVVGVALRTQEKIKPVFVSIGHRISLPTAMHWVLKMCPAYRLPETTRQADQLVNKMMKN